MQKIKHISFAVFIISFGFSINAQNTIPTTTCTGALKVNDSLSVSKNITASGDITSTGEVVSKDTLRAQKDIIVDGNAKIAGDLYVNGNTTLNGLLTATKGINLDNSANSVISFSTTTSGSTMNFGKILPYPPTPTCITPNIGNSNQTFVFSGFMSSKANNGLVNSVLNVGSAPWDGNGVIEVEGSDKFGGDGNALMINYFCGRNTLINTNNSLPNGGGTVFMGNQVSMANSARIGWDPNPIDLNSNLSIHTANGNAIKVVTWNAGVKVFALNFGTTTPFTIYGDGKTRIGLRQPLSTGVHKDALLSVDGKIIATSVYITNAGGIWADYVFEKDYKKLSLDELNKFLLSQKHLPGIPTAKEIEKDGQDLGMNQIKLLEKIEESYLYIIELHKRIEALEKKNKEYENNVK